jgi:WD40 repeat protein
VPVENIGAARGHSGAITWISPTPDGKYFLTASVDKTVKLWDVADNRLVRNVAVQASIVRFVAVLPDGLHALAAGDEGNVVLSALTDGKVIHVFEAREHGAVRAFAVSGDGRRAVSIHPNGMGDIWDIAQRTRVKTLQAPGARAIALSADGAVAVIGSGDGSLGLWDLDKASLLRTFQGSHNQKHGGVYDVAITPDGTRAVSGGGDDMVRVWDLASGREIRTLSGHTNTVRTVAVSADSKRILSGSGDARIWDADSGNEIVKFERSGGGPVAFADGLILTADNFDYSIRSWKPNGQLMTFFAGNRRQ